MLGILIEFFQNDNVQLVLKFLYKTWWIWFPIGAGSILWEYWVRYRRAIYFGKMETLLLEVKLPREIFKSPRAAEFFIAGLYQTAGEKNWYEKYWKGQVRSHFSLEIVSIDGTVHFFIWTKKGHKAQIEANLYSQYPGIEVYEVPDYTLPVTYDPEKTTMWIAELELTKPDAFPIKTYLDYGMDKDPKEEYKIDPLTPLLEFLGGLPRGNQAWIQIIVRAHKAEDKDPAGGGKLIDARWAKAAEKEIEKIVAGAKGEKGPDGKIVPGTGRMLTEIEKETVTALGRSVSKAGFDVGIRVIYMAEKDIFSISNVGGIVGGITHFNSNLNGFKPTRTSDERFSNFFIAWLKRRDKKRNEEKQDMLNAYKRRAYYYKPFKSPHFILNAEELATIFHFPGQVSTTPTFERIDSRKGEPPANLPQ